MSQVQQHKFQLDESEMPTRWYNVLHDLPTPPPPPLHPGTLQPIGPDDLAPLIGLGKLIVTEAHPATAKYGVALLLRLMNAEEASDAFASPDLARPTQPK